MVMMLLFEQASFLFPVAQQGGFFADNASGFKDQPAFELIAHRYETGSLIITSNQPFSEWDNIFTDTIMTVAAIDRVVHHSIILEVEAESYRKRHAIAQNVIRGHVHDIKNDTDKGKENTTTC